MRAADFIQLVIFWASRWSVFLQAENEAVFVWILWNISD